VAADQRRVVASIGDTGGRAAPRGNILRPSIVTVGGALADPESAAVESTAGSHGPPCPGLRDQASWDDPDLLRGEILTAERLSEHAVEVARAHGDPSAHAAQGPLPRRFAEARARIAEAYGILSRAKERSRTPSPAEEWLLDRV